MFFGPEIVGIVKNMITDNKFEVTNESVILVVDDQTNVNVFGAPSQLDQVLSNYDAVVADAKTEDLEDELITELSTRYHKTLETKDPNPLIGIAAILTEYYARRDNITRPVAIGMLMRDNNWYVEYLTLSQLTDVFIMNDSVRTQKRQAQILNYMAEYALEVQNSAVYLLGYDERREDSVYSILKNLTEFEAKTVDPALTAIFIELGLGEAPRNYGDLIAQLRLHTTEFEMRNSISNQFLKLYQTWYSENTDVSDLLTVVFFATVQPMIMQHQDVVPPVWRVAFDLLPTQTTVEFYNEPEAETKN